MKRIIVISALSAAAIMGCTSGIARLHADDASQRYMDYASLPIEQFTSFRLDSWTPVARNKLVVWTGVNEAYLVTVWNTCPDLQFADHIGITSTSHTVSKFEHVTVGQDRCPISEIRSIDIRQMKADKAAAAAHAAQG